MYIGQEGDGGGKEGTGGVEGNWMGMAVGGKTITENRFGNFSITFKYECW